MAYIQNTLIFLGIFTYIFDIIGRYYAVFWDFLFAFQQTNL